MPRVVPESHVDVGQRLIETQAEHFADRQDGRFFVGAQLVDGSGADLLVDGIGGGEPPFDRDVLSNPRGLQRAPVGIENAKLIAAPEVAGVAGPQRIDQAVRRNKFVDGAFCCGRTQDLAGEQRAVRAACDAVGERAADVDPKLPARVGRAR